MVGTILRGIAASPGIVIGSAAVLKPPMQSRPRAQSESAELGIERWLDAREKVKASLDRLIETTRQNGATQEQALLEAQQMMVMDPDLETSVREKVLGGASAEHATNEAIEGYAATMAEIADEYLRQRADDVREMGQALLRVLDGQNPFPIASLAPGSVLCAAELGAASLLTVKRSALLGIALGSGGPTSHVAILARSWGVPAILGIPALVDAVSNGDQVALDGGRGELWVRPDRVELVRLEGAARQFAADNAGLARLKDRPTVTPDGLRIELLANIGRPQDVAAALDAGAEGVGLFRTEFLITGRQALPTEQEQRAEYREALESMKGRPVIVRSFDIGGDKPVPALDLEPEANPFLGYRGIRIGLDRPDLLATQFRALLAAGNGRQLKVMLPMVSTIDEVRKAREIFHQAAAALGQDMRIPLGVMVETPAAALLAARLVREVQFFSIGTNDLIQYTMAADRTNDRVASLYQPFHPSVLRLIRDVASAAAEANIPCGICGEMAGDPRATALLIGLGVRELSMSAGSIPAVKRQVLRTNHSAALKLAREALGMPSARDVEELVNQFMAGSA